jgi:hypothetical protein
MTHLMSNILSISYNETPNVPITVFSSIDPIIPIIPIGEWINILSMALQLLHNTWVSG